MQNPPGPYSSLYYLNRVARGSDYSEQVGLIMAGSISPPSRTVEISTDGGVSFQNLTDIPWGEPTEPETAGPCVVILDEDTAFIAGGADGVSTNRTSHCDTYLLDLNTKQWTQGPNMTHCRFWHSCSLITNATSGEREVVIVGGTDQQRENRCQYIKEVEIVNLDTMQVRNGETNMNC